MEQAGAELVDVFEVFKAKSCARSALDDLDVRGRRLRARSLSPHPAAGHTACSLRVATSARVSGRSAGVQRVCGGCASTAHGGGP